MSIREYSMTRDSTRQLSPSFRVREFACKGSDVVLIDDELVVLLQCIREHFGKPVADLKANQHRYRKHCPAVIVVVITKAPGQVGFIANQHQ
jgi:hypothetical protein